VGDENVLVGPEHAERLERYTGRKSNECMASA